MTFSFKYKQIKRPNPLLPQQEPVIPITLVGPNDKFETYGLLDSGADISAIPEPVADIIGLPKGGKQDKVIGINGNAEAIASRVTLLIKGVHQQETLDLPVNIIISEKADFNFIIGRAGFLNRFEITFNEAQRKITLKPLRGQSTFR